MEIFVNISFSHWSNRKWCLFWEDPVQGKVLNVLLWWRMNNSNQHLLIYPLVIYWERRETRDQQMRNWSITISKKERLCPLRLPWDWSKMQWISWWRKKGNMCLSLMDSREIRIISKVGIRWWEPTVTWNSCCFWIAPKRKWPNVSSIVLLNRKSNAKMIMRRRSRSDSKCIWRVRCPSWRYLKDKTNWQRWAPWDQWRIFMQMSVVISCRLSRNPMSCLFWEDPVQGKEHSVPIW